jgi:hypothetical protein
MMLFNAEGFIQKYASPEDILREFFDLRLAYYTRRRSALLRVGGMWAALVGGWVGGVKGCLGGCMGAACTSCIACLQRTLGCRPPPALLTAPPSPCGRPGCCPARCCLPARACLQAAEADLLRISNKVRFILAVVNGELALAKRRKADIEAELEAEGYDKLPTQKKALAQVRTGAGWRWARGMQRAAAGACSVGGWLEMQQPRVLLSLRGRSLFVATGSC